MLVKTSVSLDMSAIKTVLNLNGVPNRAQQQVKNITRWLRFQRCLFM